MYYNDFDCFGKNIWPIKCAIILILMIQIYTTRMLETKLLFKIYSELKLSYPGSDRNAAGYKAAGNSADPQGGSNIGDHNNGPVCGIRPLKCVTGGTEIVSEDRFALADVCLVGDGDGEHRRFLFSVATIASFATLFIQNAGELFGNHVFYKIL